MRVSVIVPVYNAENVLHYCIDSILNQTFKDYELILVDDGSTDNSSTLCDEYASKNENIIVKHICNGGVSKARNIGIDLAKGEYICFVDSDDFIDAAYIEELTTAMDRGYHFALCGYYERHNYKLNSEVRQIVYRDDSQTEISKQDLMSISELVLLPQPWNKMFSRCIINENNIRFPEDLSLGEDTAFVYSYLSCIIEQEFVVINKALYNYVNTKDPSSLLNKYRNDLFDEYKKLNEKLKYEVFKWDLPKEQLQLFYNACYYRMENVLFNTFHSENKVKDIKKIHYNSFVIKTNEFQKSYKLFKGKNNFVYHIAYRIKSFLPIYFLMLFRGQKNDKKS